MTNIQDFIEWFSNFITTITTINVGSITLISLLTIGITLIIIKFAIKKVGGL